MTENAHWLETARHVLASRQFAQYQGFILDGVTASMLCQIHDSLSGDRKLRFAAMPLTVAVSFGWTLVRLAQERAAGERNL